MLSKAKEIFSCCTSNNYVALPTEIPVKIKDKNDKANIKRTIPKSIFELGHPDNHRAVILNNQELFKSIQADTVAILDDYVENMPRFDAIKKNLYDKTATYSVHDFIQTHSKERTITRKLRQFSDVLIKQLENQQKNKMHLSFTKGIPHLQIGTLPSNALHKDNGMRRDRYKNSQFDYTIVIPVVDYDLSGNKNHNFSPQSTQILPMEFKNIVPEYDKKIENRKAVFYKQLEPETQENIKKHLVSEPLQQGTAIILRTATAEASDDDGQSVIHQSPETPDGFVRCFIIERANNKP